MLGVAGNEDGDAFGDPRRQALAVTVPSPESPIIEFRGFMTVQIQSAMRRKIGDAYREFGGGRAIRRR